LTIFSNTDIFESVIESMGRRGIFLKITSVIIMNVRRLTRSEKWSPSQITAYHNADYPSHLILPIKRGNIIGAFKSGGKPYL
jgi:hypothetical protein